MHRIAVADPVLSPRPVTGTEFILLRDFEAALPFLEETPVSELWIVHDLTDTAGITTLVNYLVDEGPWEGRSQIGLIVVYSASRAQSQDLISRLSGYYPLRWSPLSRHDFENLPD